MRGHRQRLPGPARAAWLAGPARAAWLAGVLMLAATGARAVMPPEFEARAAQERIEAAAAERAAAPVVVRLAILKTKVKTTTGNRCPSTEAWTVKARVLAVTRGALAPGDKVVLAFTQEHYTCPGPVREALPSLEKGQQVDAWLRCEGRRCAPAAGAMSFMDEVTFAQEQLRRGP